jgi:hypothetical protein
MPYASHRVVGVMELESPCTLVELNPIRVRHSLADGANAATIRRIAFEMSDTKSTPSAEFEPTVKVNSATLRRELEAELEKWVGRYGTA